MKQSSFTSGQINGRKCTKLVSVDTSVNKSIIYVMTSLRYDDDKSKMYGETVSLTVNEAKQLIKTLSSMVNQH